MLPKSLIKYCCGDISKIENYEQALNDKTNVWICHHRMETDYKLSVKELKNRGLYWNRPVDELILLPKCMHISLHQKGRVKSVEERCKISDGLKGNIPWNKGKKCPQMSGENNPNYGKHPSEETTRKNIENQPNRKSVYQIDKNTGEIIKEWISIRSAAKSIGINYQNIIQCCKIESRSAGGFLWRYAV